MDGFKINVERRPLFSVPWCPVCAGTGELLCLRAVGQPERYFFFCTTCGNAYRQLPKPRNALDEINRLRHLAPNGIEIPTEIELASFGLLRDLNPASETEFEDLIWHLEREYSDD